MCYIYFYVSSIYIYIYIEIYHVSLAGDSRAFNEASSKRNRDSMKKLLQLDPEHAVAVDTSEETRNSLNHDRTVPLQGEMETIWAIQLTNSSRQAIPSWISQHISRAVHDWSQENSYWTKLMGERANVGKPLTKMQQEKYTDFLGNGTKKRLLFNKVSQTCVKRLRQNACLENVKEKFFSIEIAMSTNPDDLLIRAGNGESKQLVMLQSTPSCDEHVPEWLDQGVENEVLDDLNCNKHVEEHMEGDVDEETQHQEHMMDEENALLVEDQALVDVEDDAQEIMANTSDEEVLHDIVPSKFVRVKSFFSRPAYQKLEKRGLTMIPRHMTGVFLSFHSSTNTWQGIFPGASSGMCFTFGGKTKRFSNLNNSTCKIYKYMCTFNYILYLCVYIYIRFIRNWFGFQQFAGKPNNLE